MRRRHNVTVTGHEKRYISERVGSCPPEKLPCELTDALWEMGYRMYSGMEQSKKVSGLLKRRWRIEQTWE